MEQEFEEYWESHRQLLINHAPKSLQEERKSNTKMNTAGDYDQHLILNGLGNLVVTAVLGVLVFMGSELLKPYVTRKRSLLEIDDDIKQYYYRVYKEKGLKFIEESLS